MAMSATNTRVWPTVGRWISNTWKELSTPVLSLLVVPTCTASSVEADFGLDPLEPMVMAVLMRWMFDENWRCGCCVEGEDLSPLVTWRPGWGLRNVLA